MNTASISQSAKIQTQKFSHIFMPLESGKWSIQKQYKSHIQKISKSYLKDIDCQKMNKILAKNYLTNSRSRQTYR